MHPVPSGAPTWLYTTLVLVHIFTGLIAIGFNLTYGIWIARAARNAATLAFALAGVKFIDDYMANPCYLAAGASGLLLLLLGKEVRSFLWVAMALYVLVMLCAYLVYTPLLRRQIAALAAAGPDDPGYRSLAGQTNRVGMTMGIVAVVIVVLKAYEPAFW